MSRGTSRRWNHTDIINIKSNDDDNKKEYSDEDDQMFPTHSHRRLIRYNNETKVPRYRQFSVI